MRTVGIVVSLLLSSDQLIERRFFFSSPANYPNVIGFDPMVNQRLLPPTFPRYTKIKPRIEALEYIDELLNRLKVVTRITNYTGFHAVLVSN